MAGILGSLLQAFIFGDENAALSADLNALAPAEYAPTPYDRPASYFVSGNYGTYRIAATNNWAIAGEVAGSFLQDFYFRVYVEPARIDLGNLVTSQTRQITVWNAFPVRSVQLADTQLIGGEGINITAPGALPIQFNALQERQWEINVETSGPPVIDARFIFEFTDLDAVPVVITGNRLLAWPIPPDWGRSVDEALVWVTEVQAAVEGQETRIPHPEAPRRTWEFDLVEDNRARRLLENILFDWTSRIWALPVWPDVTRLASELGIGATQILLDTSGLDFRIGGLVMLWSDLQRFELVEVEDVLSDRLTLVRPTISAWPRGARVYPCRTAYLTDAPQIRRKSDRVVTTRARFEAAEPCDWPAVPPATSYLGYPVLEHAREESDDPVASYPREVEFIDGGVGLVELDDISGRSRPRQSHAWLLHGRAERAQMRSLLYWLQGRAEALWVPTGTDDLTLLETIGSSATVLTVSWAGVARYLRAQAGRRHLRIALHSGVVLYAEVTEAVEVDDDTEQLLLDQSFGQSVAPSQVRRISWMMLARQASDRVEFDHAHDAAGIARVATSFVHTPEGADA